MSNTRIYIEELEPIKADEQRSKCIACVTIWIALLGVCIAFWAAPIAVAIARIL